MKNINLLMVDDFFVSKPSLISEESFKEYLGMEDLNNQELKIIHKLCDSLKKYKINYELFDNYYLNYELTPIGKVFDLLKVGLKSIINIELKSQNLDSNSILQELETNHNYLSNLKKQIHCYTFIADQFDNRLYYYKKNMKNIQKVEIGHLSKHLEKIRDDD